MNDLLKLAYVGPLLRSRWTWRIVRAACLALFVLMIAWGWHHHRIAGVDVPDPLMYTNLANHLFWVWWIMGVVGLALLFGRGWCAVCPLGWLNGLCARVGLRREIPPWLRTFIPAALVLILLQLLVYFLKMHRFPDYTAVLLAVCLLLAAASGLLFRERAFCRLLCPAGAIFGLYARFAPFHLRVRDRAVCHECDTQRCIAEPEEWSSHRLGSLVLYRRRRLDGCPVGLVPAEIEQSADCTLCLNCLHNCDKDNVKVGFRRWGADLAGGLRPTETFFFLVLLGLLTANFSKVYVDLRDRLFWLPERSAELLGWQEHGFYVLAAVWIAFLLPLLLVLPGYFVMKLGEVESVPLPGPPASEPAPDRAARAGFWADLGRLALPLIPLVLAGHLVLALVKINAKAAYLPYALGEPSGVRSYLAFNVMQTVSPPGVFLSLDLLKWVLVAVLSIGFAFSLRVSAREARADAGRSRTFLAAGAVGAGILFSLYLATVIEWLFVR